MDVKEQKPNFVHECKDKMNGKKINLNQVENRSTRMSYCLDDEDDDDGVEAFGLSGNIDFNQFSQKKEKINNPIVYG